MTAPVPPRRRALVLGARTSLDTELLARVTSDDVLHARTSAETIATAQYRRYLSATLDTRHLIPEGDT